ncbi:MAG: outer membrane protein assembly factor BamD [Myxococcota bacterium]
MFAALALWMTVSAPAWAQSEPTADELVDLGMKQLKRGNYTKALATLQRVRNYYRDDKASIRAQLVIADLHFKKRDFEQARFAYEEFRDLHPNHPQIDYVTWRIGQSVYKRASKFAGRDQGATRSAVTVWSGFDRRFPDSEYIDDVEKLLGKGRARLANKELYVAKFYLRRGAYASVRGRAEGLVRRYGDTEAAVEGYALLGMALHATGEVDSARAVRDKLAERAPKSKELEQLDRALQKPAGTPPEKTVFVRPYRTRGGGGQPGAPQ